MGFAMIRRDRGAVAPAAAERTPRTNDEIRLLEQERTKQYEIELSRLRAENATLKEGVEQLAGIGGLDGIEEEVTRMQAHFESVISGLRVQLDTALPELEKLKADHAAAVAELEKLKADHAAAVPTQATPADATPSAAEPTEAPRSKKK